MSLLRNINGDDSLGCFLRRAVRGVAMSAIVCAGAFDPTSALAQKKSDEPEVVEKSYTLPYFFSGIAVLMIVVPLCLPSLRKTEAPKEEDD